jgi:hypothetical protein
MKLTHLLTSLALVTSAACKKTDADNTQPPAPGTSAKTSEPAAKPAASGRSIPNVNGLTVDAPAKWLDNGIGGAGGMHLDADAGMFMIRETSADEAGKKLAAFKTDTEEMLFEKWISAEELPAGGFKAVYVMDKIKMKGDEPVKDGTTFAFTVRRTIASKVYDCSGNGATEANAKEAIDLCLKVNAS